MSRGRCTTTSVSRACRDLPGRMMSTGSSAGRSTPHVIADERCEAIASGPAASTAASIRISAVVGAPYNRITFRCRSSATSAETARFHCLRVNPDASKSRSPRCRLAYRSKSRGSTSHRSAPTPLSRKATSALNDLGAKYPRAPKSPLARGAQIDEHMSRRAGQLRLGAGQRWQRGQ